MTVKITFVSHSTTLDNEAKRASGWNDIPLSELGKQQALELKERQKNNHYDTIFTSDLIRAIKTAEIAFSGRNIPIITDPRLRECHYGDMTQYPNSEIEQIKLTHLRTPFPNGESYIQTNRRMKSFLDDIQKTYQNRHILIVGHRATHYALDFYLKHIPMKKLLTTKFVWQPAFEYEME